MANKRFKRLIEDLENNTTLEVSAVAKATSAGYGGTSAKATSAGAAGTALAVNARIMNRVLAGVGTAGTKGLADIGTGGTGGVRIGNAVSVDINGRHGTVSAQLDLELPSGSQAAATVVKYLVSSGFGSSGTVTAGAEAASGTLALLPSLPANHVALGYVQYTAHASNAYVRTNAVLTGMAPGTSGTAAFVDLLRMPVSE